MAGIRIGAGRAVKGAIVAERIVGPIGLGGLIQRLGGAFAVGDLYAVIIFVGVGWRVWFSWGDWRRG
jgi:ABC-type nitrate/sulfonate/bicarbonate transport system permease component